MYSHNMIYICIDDLLTLNNSEFVHRICDIYPPEPELKNKKTVLLVLHVHVHVHVTITNWKYSTDKWDSFTFNIVI